MTSPAASACPRPPLHRLRILVVDSVPTTYAGVHFDRKQAALRSRLGPHLRAGLLELILEPAASPERLAQVLRQHRPDILHILCHAKSAPGTGARVLVFEGHRGRCQALDAPALRALLAAYAPRLVILEACGSLPLTDALVGARHDEPEWALGFAHAICPTLGTIFIPTFYQGLASGLDLVAAFAEARRDLELLAPGALSTPVLRGQGHPLRLAAPPRAAFRSIAPEDLEDHVHRPAALRPLTAPLLGRSPDLDRLNRAWYDPDPRRSAILHLRGAPGVGKTHLVRGWLDALAASGWPGASRVFTWSFEPGPEGSSPTDIHAFLARALAFYGDPDRDPVPLDLGQAPAATERPSDFIRESSLLGLRLGRLLRREPSLLVLDGVPLLPHAAGAADRPPEALLHPALATLLRALARAAHGLCLLVTHDRAPSLALDGRPLPTLDLPGLEPPDAVELLWQRGALAPDRNLAALAEALAGHPLALELAAAAELDPPALQRALAATQPGAPLVRLLRALALDDARPLLGSLLDHDGHLCEPPDHTLATLRRLTRHGITAVSSAPRRVAITHRALQGALQDALPDLPSTPPPHLDAEPPPRPDLDHLLARARAAHRALRAGDPRAAAAIYAREIARYDWKTEQWSYLARHLGGIAEELEILAPFFPRGVDGGRDWSTLDAPVRDAVEDPTQALLLHRAALALRHLGSLADAEAPLTAAWRLYDRIPDHERAAICANDLAELSVWRGELHAASARAVNAVDAADRSGHWTAQMIARATRGHIHHLLGDRDTAHRDFRDAEAHLPPNLECRDLGSRPGHMYWELLLDDLEDDLRARRDPAAITERLAVLDRKIANAAKFHKQPHVARVSAGLDALARGRLAALCAAHALPLPQPSPVSATDLALTELSRAITLYRQNQHAWMLPLPLLARARLRRTVLNDLVNARIDLADARDVADALDLPLLRVACLLDQIDQDRAQHPAAPLDPLLHAAHLLLDRHPCPHLAARLHATRQGEP